MRAWLVWGTAVLAYIVSVLHRTSFGVSGLAASERFTIPPTTLSAFVVLQLIVYAAMQVPAGVLLDRFGPRRLIVTASLVMAAGQFALAFAEALPLAILGRAVVGGGDALIFISALRLVPQWFPFRRVPVLTQLTGILGQFGQILSAVPFLALLHASGWSVAFTATAALGVLAGILTLAAVRDVPPGQEAPRDRIRIRATGQRIRAVWARPGTKLGFFAHLGTQFSFNAFALMWGVPYLMTAQEISSEAAGALLSLAVFSGVFTGPALGTLSARFPRRRTWLVLGVIGANATIWTITLVWSSPVPFWLLVLLVLIIATGPPGSMIGFDFARSFNPAPELGTAQGLVNTGGFIATLLAILLIGVVLDLTGGYTFDGFRLAFGAQYLLWAIAVVGVLGYRRLIRRP